MWGAGYSLDRRQWQMHQDEQQAAFELAALCANGYRSLDDMYEEVGRRAELMERLQRETAVNYQGTPRWRALKSVLWDIRSGYL